MCSISYMFLKEVAVIEGLLPGALGGEVWRGIYLAPGWRVEGFKGPDGETGRVKLNGYISISDCVLLSLQARAAGNELTSSCKLPLQRRN